MKVVKQIDIYLERKRNVKVIDVVQYDKANQLVFTVKDFTIPTGTTGTLYVQKPSGKFVYQEDGITIADNTITINLENQAITEHGKVPYQVTLKNGSDDITTFEGLMMVQRSLKDSGATESKTVIRAFDNAVLERVAEFRTQAETIAAGVIATIPEDYTEMAAKVNQLANAIKGNLLGEVVFADDVSPIEHNPSVKIHGKNLAKPQLYTVTNTDCSYESPWQCSVTVEDDGKIVLTNTKTSGVCFARICEVTLKKGKTYVFSKKDIVNISEVHIWYHNTTNTVWIDTTQPLTVSEDIDIDIVVYMNDISTSGNQSSLYIQLEEGDTKTDYKPWVDPSTVIVTKCGKNLLPKRTTVGTNAGNGVTQKINVDGSVKITGTATAPAYLGIENIYNLPKGVYYLTGNTSSESLLIAGAYNGDAYVFEAQDRGEGIILDLTDKTFDHVRVMMYVPQGVTVSKTIYPMLSTDIGGTEYERLLGTTTHIPSSDGTVEGVTSLSPNMTILTDTENVIVECEYNKDTNKVIQKICSALGISV